MLSNTEFIIGTFFFLEEVLLSYRQYVISKISDGTNDIHDYPKR